jgi:hypothetical protein
MNSSFRTLCSFHPFRANQLTHILQDDQVREVTPKIMNLLKTRIEGLFLEISRIAPHDPVLKTLSNLSQVANRIAESVQMRHPPMHAPGHMGAPY